MGLLDYIKANTPRATTPRVKPGTVVREGLLNPNQFNAPAANRFKDSLFGLAGVVPGVGDIASGVEAADYWNRGEKGNAGLAALGMLPFVPALGGMIKSIKPTKYELAQLAAQKNAVDMLGLPPGNTAMDRAKAMGFDTPAYHGSPLPDAAEAGKLKTSYPEEAVFLADEPYNANAYARSARYPGVRTAQPNVIPVLTKSKNMDVYDFGGKEKTRGFDVYINSAKHQGKDGVVFNDVIDEPGYGGNVRAILDPKNIRSRFAAFDPARANESDLLAGIAPYLGLGGLLGLGLYGGQDDTTY